MKARPVALALAAAAALAAAGVPDGHAAPPGTPPGKSTSATSPNGQGNGNGNGNGKPTTTAPAKTAKKTSGSGQGIVQSLVGNDVVLTELDGSTVTIAVTPATSIFVDGSKAAARAIEPGFVLSARWVAGKAQVLQAFDLSSPGAVQVGVVRSVSATTIVVARSDGGTVRIRIDRRTRVRLDGRTATLQAVKTGFTAVFTATDAKGRKPASELRFLRPV